MELHCSVPLEPVRNSSTFFSSLVRRLGAVRRGTGWNDDVRAESLSCAAAAAREATI